jgi:hypothetical protein
MQSNLRVLLAIDGVPVGNLHLTTKLLTGVGRTVNGALRTVPLGHSIYEASPFSGSASVLLTEKASAAVDGDDGFRAWPRRTDAVGVIYGLLQRRFA